LANITPDHRVDQAREALRKQRPVRAFGQFLAVHDGRSPQRLQIVRLLRPAGGGHDVEAELAEDGDGDGADAACRARDQDFAGRRFSPFSPAPLHRAVKYKPPVPIAWRVEARSRRNLRSSHL